MSVSFCCERVRARRGFSRRAVRVSVCIQSVGGKYLTQSPVATWTKRRASVLFVPYLRKRQWLSVLFIRFILDLGVSKVLEVDKKHSTFYCDLRIQSAPLAGFGGRWCEHPGQRQDRRGRQGWRRSPSAHRHPCTRHGRWVSRKGVVSPLSSPFVHA